jgi:DNA-binding response OmpR family regulator
VSAHVLIVEDSALVIGALRVLLEETGHRVSAAQSVREAVDTARRDRPDVMLLDLTLPDGHGLDVLQGLAAADEAPRVIVALTGHDDSGLRERCLDAGCRAVLLKPIRASELPGQIAGWLREQGK